MSRLHARPPVRPSPLFFALLGVLLFAPAAAPPPELGAQERPAFHAETGVLVSSSWFGLYLGSEPHVLWKPSWLGAGIGAKLSVGGSQFDVHAAPFVRLEAGWWYANAGWSFELLDMTSRFQLMKNGAYVATGLAPDVVQFGYGRIGVDLGLETFVPVPYPPAERPPSDVLLFGSRLDGWLLDSVRFMVETTLLRVGLLYTFPL